MTCLSRLISESAVSMLTMNELLKHRYPMVMIF